MVTISNYTKLLELIRERLCQIKVYFNIVDFYDEKLLKKECKKNGLNVVILDRLGLNGVICVSLNVIPLFVPSIQWFETEIRKRFKIALINTMKDTDNREKIESYLRKSDFANNFCHMISLINQRIRKGKEDIGRLRNYLKRYETQIGEEGIELFLKMFKEKKDKKILKSYSTYNEFVLKKYQIELFITQQVNQIYLTIISIKSDLIKANKDYYFVDVDGLKKYSFQLIKWHHPFLHRQSELYKCQDNEHIILLPRKEQPNKANEALIGLRLTCNNLCSGVNIIKDVLEQEDKHSEEALEELPTYLNSIRDNLVMANSKEVEEIQEIILAHQNTSTAMLLEFYKPIKRDFEKYLLKKRRMDNLIEDQITKIPLRTRGETITVVKIDLPFNFGMNLPSKEIKIVHNLVIRHEERTKKILDAYRELNAQLELLKYVKKMMGHKLSEAEHKEMMQKESRILSAISNLVEIVKNLYEIFKP